MTTNWRGQVAIETGAMWDEYELEKIIDEKIALIRADHDAGALKEEEEFDLIIDRDGSSMTLTVKALEGVCARDLLDLYKAKTVEVLDEYRSCLEDGIKPEKYYIN